MKKQKICIRRRRRKRWNFFLFEERIQTNEFAIFFFFYLKHGDESVKKNANWPQFKIKYTMENTMLISCLMVYDSHLYSSMPKHRIGFSCWFVCGCCCCCFFGLVLIWYGLVSSLFGFISIFVRCFFVDYTFNEHLRISISMRERCLLYRSIDGCCFCCVSIWWLSDVYYWVCLQKCHFHHVRWILLMPNYQFNSSNYFHLLRRRRTISHTRVSD